MWVCGTATKHMPSECVCVDADEIGSLFQLSVCYSPEQNGMSGVAFSEM
jgi:hypothetical protein